MKKNNKNKITYTKAELIKMLAVRSRVRVSIVQKVYEGFVDLITELLSSADDNADVSLRLFEGLSIDSSLLPEEEKLNNITGEIITTKSKIKAKANITKYYRNKLTKLAKGE